jgi:hypothetical protein
MAVLHNNANRDFMHLKWKIYYYELVTGMEKDIHVVTKGRALLQIEKKGRASLGQGRVLRPVKRG